MTWSQVTTKQSRPRVNDEPPSTTVSEPLRIIKNVHKDDIHALISLSNGSFASGSKDTTIKIWDRDWNLIKTVRHSTQKKFQGYCHWITAMTVFKNGYFASATRDGSLAIWSEEGKEISCCQKQNDPGSVAKERNIFRINCLHQLPVVNDKHLFLVGSPTCLSTWEWDWDNTMNDVLSTKVHDNDWVYCIKQLNPDDCLIAIGSDLEIWRKTSTDEGIVTSWSRHQSVVRENPNEVTGSGRGKKQRPHISCMEFITEHKVALACFGGFVKILDIEHEMAVSTCKPHKGRVWTVAKVADNLFATGADDHTALLWDVRQEVPVKSLVGKSNGRVSCLLALDGNRLLAASCPDQLPAPELGCFTFWDLRKS